jgi:hypothetical protein
MAVFCRFIVANGFAIHCNDARNSGSYFSRAGSPLNRRSTMTDPDKPLDSYDDVARRSRDAGIADEAAAYVGAIDGDDAEAPASAEGAADESEAHPS